MNRNDTIEMLENRRWGILQLIENLQEELHFVDEWLEEAREGEVELYPIGV